MAEMSRRFNFDDFDEQVREALEDNDAAMAEVFALGGMKRVIAPTKFGGLRPDEVPSSNVVDLNANVVDLQPPDDAA